MTKFNELLKSYREKIDDISSSAFNAEQKELAKSILEQCAEGDLEFQEKLEKAINILDNAKRDEFERVKIALNILKSAPQSSLDDIYTFITKRINLGFVFDAAPEANHSCISLLKHNENLSFNTNLALPVNAQHKLIIGENYDALKNLLVTHREKIDVIYIDPPYNTEAMKSDGNDYKGNVKSSKFIYRDKFTRTGWLNMMNERLKLARELLSDSGVIFISIDDNEQAYLKVLCDEIFGEENFVMDFVRKTKSTTNDARQGINLQHESCLCYAKNKSLINLLGGEKDLSKYQNPDNDPLGAWVITDPSAKSGNIATGYFGVTNPYTGKVDYPPEGRFWLFSQNTLQKHIDEGRICFKKEHKDNERGFIYKRHLKDLKTTLKTFDSLKFISNEFMNQVATKELKDLGLVELFKYPKPTNFIKEIILHATNGGGGADTKPQIILDFFAGSGTTAQAVMELNKQDGGKRQCILVTNNENNIAKNVTYERIYRICKGVGTKGESFEWASKNEALEDNGWDIFEIETHDLEYKDDKRANEFIKIAEKQFKIFKKDFEFEGEFDIYNKLSSLSPKKDEK